MSILFTTLSDKQFHNYFLYEIVDIDIDSSVIDIYTESGRYTYKTFS